MPTKKQATIDDVLSAFGVFANDQEKRMQRIEGDISEMKGDLSIIKRKIGILESDVSSLKKEVLHIENHMVTKEYLDRKLGDLQDNWKIILGKEDAKLLALIKVIVAKKVVSEADVAHIVHVELFPKVHKI